MATLPKIVLVIWTIMVITIFILRQKIPIFLIYLLNNREYDYFDQIIDKIYVKIFLSRFKVFCLKLNSYIFRNDKSKVEGIVELVDIKGFNIKQQCYVLKQLINYYISIEDKVKCLKYLEYIKSTKNYELENFAKWSIEAIIDLEYSNLDNIKNYIKTLDPMEAFDYKLLISLMYKNMGDIEKSEEYRLSAENDIRLDRGSKYDDRRDYK